MGKAGGDRRGAGITAKGNKHEKLDQTLDPPPPPPPQKRLLSSVEENLHVEFKSRWWT